MAENSNTTASFNLEGLWQSNAGMLLIKQKGTEIEGINYTLTKEITGTITGDKIVFQWTNLSLETGYGEFKIENNGDKLTGFWSDKDNKEQKYKWEAVRYKETKESFKGEPTYWNVEETVNNPLLGKPGKAKGKAILYFSDGKVAGKFQGRFRFEDMPEQEEQFFNYFDGKKEGDRLILQWKNPIDASFVNMTLTKENETWKGNWNSDFFEKSEGQIFFSKSERAFLNDEVNLSSIIQDTISKFYLIGGLIHHGKAQALFFKNDYQAAIAEGEKAVSLFQNADNEDQLAIAYAFVANTYHRAGKTDQAIATLEKSISSFKKPNRIAQAYDQLGAIYQDIGKYKEARDCYKKVLNMGNGVEEFTRKSAEMDLEIVNYIELKSKGDELDGDGKKQEAIAVWNEVLKGYERIFKEYNHFYKDPFSLNSYNLDQALVTQRIAFAYDQLQQFDNAIKYFENTIELFKKLNAKQNVAGLTATLGTIYERKGDAAKAEEYFSSALKMQKEINSPDIWQTYHKRANFYKKQGRNKESLDNFESAITKIENLRSGLDTDETKIGFFAQKIFPYHDYINFLMQQKPDESFYLKALEITERARSRALLELMAKSDSLISEPTASDKLFFDELISDKTILPLTYQQIIEKVKQGQTIYIDYFMDENYFAMDKHIYVWILFPSGKVNWLEISPYKTIVQSTEDFRGKSLTTATPQSYKKEAENLFNILIKPLTPFLDKSPEIKQLTFVPYGILKALPFSVLMENDQFWGLQYEITYLPSLTMLKHIMPAKSAHNDRILLIGKPEGTEKLTKSEYEVKEVASLFENRFKILSGKEASKDNVLSEIGKYQYLLFSTHGEFDTDNPRQSHLELANGEKLTLKDINNLKINAKIVVLSACDTHTGKPIAGDELISLSRGFLASGSSYALATLWKVDDRASANIVKQFFSNIKAGYSPAKALQSAQREYIESSKPQYKRPFYWAPFILLGKHYE
ncbi:MAG TPA: CHAT domain-containing tetratricopeptide repeat protein [Thermodesulfovibrionia bacterium]|nr:CHAT domain-containing tetratricopeptide repeat protein [Thermodesulfovibrionia bacterium]